MSPRTPFIYPPAGGGVEWATLLDADFSGDAGTALANGGTITRSGVVWTFRAQSDTIQTWTPAADGIDVAVTDSTSTTNAMLADIAGAKILGRSPDDYDVIAVHALWTGVVQTAQGSLFGVALGHADTGVARAGMDRPLMAGHFRTSAESNWFARVSTATGLLQAERFLPTAVADPSGVPIVTGGVFTSGLGCQMFGAIDRATLYESPADLRGVSIFREVGVANRPQIDRVGVISITSTSTTTTATLSRIRIQHFRLPGAPDPA